VGPTAFGGEFLVPHSFRQEREKDEAQSICEAPERRNLDLVRTDPVSLKAWNESAAIAGPCSPKKRLRIGVPPAEER
jgi:hypothetical protein